MTARTSRRGVFVDRIADIVLAPTFRALPPGAVLIYTKPGEAFAFDIDIALTAGVVMAAPYALTRARLVSS